jgi:hypothetical protein
MQPQLQGCILILNQLLTKLTLKQTEFVTELYNLFNV